MKSLFAAVKKAVAGKSILSNRQGRFLTIYLENGQRKNGKVLQPGYLSSTVQLAYGPVIKVKNSAMLLVSADHKVQLVK